MAYGSLNAGSISPGSGNTLTVSEAVTFSGAVNLGTPSAGVVTNLSGVLPVGVTGGSGLTALGTVASGTLGSSVNINSAMASVTNDEVGSYCFARKTNLNSAISFGSTMAGSLLEPTNAYGGDHTSTTLSGTWMAMGLCNVASSAQNNTTLFMRTA